MDITHIPQDDLMDVMELTNKIEEQIGSILQDVPLILSISALIGASVNSLMGQCNNLDDALLFKNMFVEVLNDSIRTRLAKSPEKPS